MGKIKWNEDSLSELVKKNSDSRFLSFYTKDTGKDRKRTRIHLVLICPQCNDPYEKQLDTFIKSPFKICPTCVRNNQGKDKRIEFKQVQQKFKEYGYKLLSSAYSNSWTKMVGESKEGYKIETSYNYLQSGNAPKAFHKQNKYTIYNINKWLSIYNKDFALLSDEYINNSTDLEWFCINCENKWKTPWSNIRSGTGCPFCAESKGEKSVRRWLENNEIAFKPQKEFKGLLGLGGGSLSYDFYLPLHNVLIEYQGEFHDGTAKQQTDEEYEIQKEHDKRKKDYAKLHNITLLEIWYWEYENVDEILKGNIHINLNKKEDE